MNITQALLDALVDHGASQIFGIPGDFALPFFKIIEDSGILPLYTLCHEPGVGFAADGASRFGQHLGVAAVTYGAGALNMVNAVAAAFAERSPVVVVSGGPGKHEAGSGFLLHHQVKTLSSQFEIYREITCDQARLDDADRAPYDIARVLGNCLRHARPVYIELPRDMAGAACSRVVRDPPPQVDVDALAACAAEVLQRIAQAHTPVLMVGIEVRRYGLEDKVVELAKRLNIPAVTGLLGRGMLTREDAPLLGTYLGLAGDPAIMHLVEGSDGLLLLGEILSDTQFATSECSIDPRRTIHAWDREVSLGYHTYANIPLGALVDALLARTSPRPGRGERYTSSVPRNLVADREIISPTDIAAGVNDMMARHGKMPIACDMGDCFFTAMDMEQTELVAPGYYATMGFGVPAGLGVQAATGRRPLILVGDGAFQMTGWELVNCRRYGFDPIVIVFNNAGWEMLRAFQPGPRYHDLESLCFADIARTLGGDGMRVETRAELATALDRAYGTRGRFQLIDAVLPRGVLSKTLSRFVAGVSRLGAGR